MKTVINIIKPILKVLVIIYAVIGIVLSGLYIHSFGNMINQSNEKIDTECQDVIENKQLATTENPVLSPSGKYWLQVVQGFDGEVHFNQFYIIKASPDGKRTKNIVFICEDTYRTRDRTFFLWDNDDRIWAYSGDVGTFFWENDGVNNWNKHNAYEKGIKEPEELLKLINGK
jgi:hypothetical protein